MTKNFGLCQNLCFFWWWLPTVLMLFQHVFICSTCIIFSQFNTYYFLPCFNMYYTFSTLYYFSTWILVHMFNMHFSESIHVEKSMCVENLHFERNACWRKKTHVENPQLYYILKNQCMLKSIHCETNARTCSKSSIWLQVEIFLHVECFGIQWVLNTPLAHTSGPTAWHHTTEAEL